MNDWQLDAMIESAAASEWERQNTPEINPFPVETKLKSAWSAAGECIDKLCEAADLVEGHPFQQKIESVATALEYLQFEITKLRKEVKTL